MTKAVSSPPGNIHACSQEKNIPGTYSLEVKEVLNLKSHLSLLALVLTAASSLRVED